MNEPSVIFEVKNRIGWIFLNRPKALNSLNKEMVTLILRKLKEWENDPSVALLCIQGSGEKGLCAGGDMKGFYELGKQEAISLAHDFFLTEYEMDHTLHHYPKPVIAYMNGVVMGGGVGISIGGSHRIVTEKTKWAMPEMNIGFFPDVGASYFLNTMPGFIGRYLALTAEIIRAEDACFAGAADYFIQSEDWPKLESVLLQLQWREEDIQGQLTEVIKRYSRIVPKSTLAQLQGKIDKHFTHSTVEEILSSLETDERKGDQWAKETRSTLLTNPPLSLKVALLQLQKGEKLSLAECYQMEFTLGLNFMNNPDFYEGVRAVLVDKDRSPRWKKAVLQEVSEDEVLRYFQWDKRWGEEEALANAIKQ